MTENTTAYFSRLKWRCIGIILMLCGAGLMLSLLAGCAGNLRVSAHGAVAADAVTTVAGVASGITREANPLITSPTGLLASVALRMGAIEYINGQDEPQRTTGLAAINSVTWGIAASNLAIIASHSNPAGLVAGLAAGIYAWASTSEEREFAAICADERARNPKLQCTYTPSTTEKP